MTLVTQSAGRWVAFLRSLSDWGVFRRPLCPDSMVTVRIIRRMTIEPPAFMITVRLPPRPPVVKQ